MKKNIFLVFCLLLFMTNCYGYDYATDGFQPLNSNKVTQIEYSVLGQSYENQNIDVRLNRLEKVLFNKTFTRLSNEQRINNIVMNADNSANNLLTKNLSLMEQKIFYKTFNQDDIENRLSRLEMKMFGTIQSGDRNLRCQNLQNTLTSYLKTANRKNYYVPPRNNWNSFRGALNNFLIGSPTGFTPTIYPTGFMPPIYHPMPNYSNVRYTNRGWNFNDINTGHSTGIHILD